MATLFINIYINSHDRFQLFSESFAAISGIFDECLIKIRGEYSNKCICFVRKNYKGLLKTFEHLGNYDWVSTSLSMLDHATQRTVFIFLEDHLLVKSTEMLAYTVGEFEQFKIDYLSYSFFRAGRLNEKNILPLNPSKSERFSFFELNHNSHRLIQKIAPLYYPFSLPSICSVKYLKFIWKPLDRRLKLFSKISSFGISQIFKYPVYRNILFKINKKLSYLNAALCYYNPVTPFNTEKMLSEIELSGKDSFRIGVLHEELFANTDDDNGAYEESLVKRGLYPLESMPCSHDGLKSVSFPVELKNNETYDLMFYSCHDRIRRAPVVSIELLSGSITFKSKSGEEAVKMGERKTFFANKNHYLIATEESSLEIVVSDECF